MAGVSDEAVQFLEAAFVEKKIDAFAGRQLAGLVLPADTLGPATRLGGGIALLEFG